MFLPWSIFSASTNETEIRTRKQDSRKKKRRQQARRNRPSVEALESRLAPATFHVDVLNPNPGTGTTADPFKTIQDAVKAATASAAADDIIVYGNTSINPQNVYVWTRDGDRNNDGQL